MSLVSSVTFSPDGKKLASAVVVEGSEINRLTADGGRGDNMFEDRGGNTFGQLRLKRF